MLRKVFFSFGGDFTPLIFDFSYLGGGFSCLGVDFFKLVGDFSLVGTAVIRVGCNFSWLSVLFFWSGGDSVNKKEDQKM